ncbi:MAG: trigger factor [Deltaproteobacteria bacterium]|nr:trigger factor [Deltaproteobacteria bacterium]
MNSTEVGIKIESLSQVKKKISIDVPWDAVKEEMDSVYKKVGKTAKIKGFRNGKVPRKILESYYKEYAENETMINIVNKYYWDALKEHAIDAITEPAIDQGNIQENQAFSFSATVETEPDFDPQGYTGLKIDRDVYEITEEDVDTRLQEIRKMFSTLEDISEERDVMQGDFVLIDFQGSLNGEQLDELRSDNYTLEIGSKNFVPGFEDQLIGMKKGDTKDINVTFPQDYHSNKFAGQDVCFKVDLKGIKEKKLPEIDDDFIKNFERYDSLAALKTDIRKTLEEDAKRKGETTFRNMMVEKILEQNDFEVPSTFVEKQIHYMMADTQRRMVAGGMENKDATELSLKMHDQFKDEATKIIKSSLLLKNIAKKESINIEDHDIDDRIKEIAQNNQQDYEALKEKFEKDDSISAIESDLLNEKIFKYLEDQAEITDVKKSLFQEREGE